MMNRMILRYNFSMYHILVFWYKNISTKKGYLRMQKDLQYFIHQKKLCGKVLVSFQWEFGKRITSISTHHFVRMH